MGTYKTITTMTTIEQQRSLMEQALKTLKDIEVTKQIIQFHDGAADQENYRHKLKCQYQDYSDLMIKLSKTFTQTFVSTAVSC